MGVKSAVDSCRKLIRVNGRLDPFMVRLLEYTPGDILKTTKNSHVIYPKGKSRMPHLLRCQGFAVKYYSFTLDALVLQHPRLLQR